MLEAGCGQAWATGECRALAGPIACVFSCPLMHGTLCASYVHSHDPRAQLACAVLLFSFLSNCHTVANTEDREGTGTWKALLPLLRRISRGLAQRQTEEDDSQAGTTSPWSSPHPRVFVQGPQQAAYRFRQRPPLSGSHVCVVDLRHACAPSRKAPFLNKPCFLRLFLRLISHMRCHLSARPPPPPP